MMQYWRNRAQPEQPTDVLSESEGEEGAVFDFDEDVLRSSNLFIYLVIFRYVSKWVGFLLRLLDIFERHNLTDGDRIGGLCGLFLFAEESKRAISKIRLDFFDTILNVVFSGNEGDDLTKGEKKLA